MKPDLNYSVDRLERLTHFSVLMIEGADAEIFIHSQSMNDVTALAPGQWHWNGLLNPKGRLIALFALVRMQPGTIWLVSPDFSAEKLLTHLQRFIFRSKVKLSINRQLQAYATFAPSLGGPDNDHSSADYILSVEPPGLGLNMSGDHTIRYLWLLPNSNISATVSHTIADDQWREIDLQHGFPRLSDDQSEAWTPQMLSLERFNAFSVKKGCYPGQEIVARTHFLGQSKRRLVGVKDKNAGLVAGQSLMHEGKTVGQIVSANGSKTFALAVVNVQTEIANTSENLSDFDLLPLFNGLQRPV
jgi:tRNA-modifying protein YgfZ